MATESHAGAFNITTGTSNVSVTGVGFTPKLVLMWMVGRTEGTDTVGSGANGHYSFGWMAGATERRVVAGVSVDATSTSDAASGMRDDAVLATIDTGENWTGLADFSSFDADGFTLAVDNAFGSDFRVHYLALGGSDLTNVAMGTREIQESTGTESVTGLGFQPDALIFATARTRNQASFPKTDADVSVGIGFASGTTAAEQARWAGNAEDAVATSNTHAFCATGECLGQLWQDQTGHAFRAALDSFDADGFTLDWLATHGLAGSDDYFWLALGGGNYEVGSALTQTDTTTDIAESGFGFAPSGGLVVSHGRAADTGGSGSSEFEMSLGAFSAPSERGAQAAKDEDAQGTTDITRAVEHDAVYANLTAGSALEGLMDVKSLDSDGVTFIMDDADPSQAFFAYLAVGPGGPAPPSPPSISWSGEVWTVGDEDDPEADEDDEGDPESREEPERAHRLAGVAR